MFLNLVRDSEKALLRILSASGSTLHGKLVICCADVDTLALPCAEKVCEPLAMGSCEFRTEVVCLKSTMIATLPHRDDGELFSYHLLLTSVLETVLVALDCLMRLARSSERVP